MKHNSIIVAFFFGLFWPLMVFAQNNVGIIIEGYEQNCEISHLGKTYQCEKRRELFIGDTIKKEPSVKHLRIKWAPYVEGAETGLTHLRVVASKPDKLKSTGLIDSIKQYVNDFVKAPTYGKDYLVTRGTGSLPPFATLHNNYPLRIKEVKYDLSVIVINSKGIKVWETNVKSGGELLISPVEIPILANEKYTLAVEMHVDKDVSSITLMDETLQNEVNIGFETIGSEKASSIDQLIRRVAYCQLLSDIYPDKVDLYWLGRQLIKENTAKPSEEQQKVIDGLDERYFNHFSSNK